MRYSFDKGQG